MPSQLSTKESPAGIKNKDQQLTSLYVAIQVFVNGALENRGFLFETEESADHIASKAEENTYNDYYTTDRLLLGGDEEDEARRPVLVVRYVKPTSDDAAAGGAAT